MLLVREIQFFGEEVKDELCVTSSIALKDHKLEENMTRTENERKKEFNDLTNTLEELKVEIRKERGFKISLPRPSGLPPTDSHFTGRQKTTDEIIGHLDNEFRASESGIVDRIDKEDCPSKLRLKLLFESSYQRLPMQEKEHAVSLCILHESFNPSAAAAVMGFSRVFEARKILQTLKKNLLLTQEPSLVPFQCIPLIQSFAKVKGDREMPDVLLNSKYCFHKFYISRFKELNTRFQTGHSMSAFKNFYEEKESIFESLVEDCSDCTTSDMEFNVLVKAKLLLDSLFWLLSEAANFNKIYSSAINAAKKFGHFS
ncbi:hypothetical protein AWC38_SpisGene1911 [Stylophora pistillata]|uniref:Uncharacterized protein n=1 Tax=Stylophora pistillata TaxID=50429 RepID=A0A2B4SWJ4_STYPI|nr:hypothetical protein AWC38_SpisGene1911 [Stylophora pistillata]